MVLFVRLLFIHKPIMEISEQGILLGRAPFGSIFTSWEDIICLQILELSKRSYYLVVFAKHPETIRLTPLKRLDNAIYPFLSDAAMTIALGVIYFLPSKTKCQKLLRQIYATFPEQIRFHDILVYFEDQDITLSSTEGGRA